MPTKPKTKEVVINGCFGGFNLSHAAIMRYAELSGFKLYTYVNPPGDFRSYVPYDGKEKAFIVHYTKQPVPEGGSPSDAEYFSDRMIPRDDPNLVAVVKEMRGAANGMCAELVIVKIPSDVAFEIEEYDGSEHIAEAHRTWR